jgi:hypothetical protein
VSTISVDYDVLNQRGSPAWFSDTFANIPTFGFKGRMFISIDTFAFYRDTGTGWDLIGGPGSGTLTGSGVAGQVSYFNGTQTITGSNNLFWDNSNARLGIGTATPSAPLDIHAVGTNATFNGTGTNNASLVFQNAGASKWTIGNSYSAGSNLFVIYNNTTSASALSIDITTNAISSNGTGIYSGSISLKQNGSVSAGTGYTTLSGSSAGQLTIYFGDANLYAATILNTSLTASRSYTLPNATGTLALTSDLSSYLPLAGGTLTGGLYINPTNTAITGLDVASNTTIIRSDNLEGFKRQLEITMSSGTLIQLVAKGYGANYGTDLAFYTATTGGTNTTPGIYLTGTNNRMGIGTGTPTARVSILGTGAANSIMTETCLSAGNSNGILIGSDGTDALIGVNNSGTNMSFLSRVGGVYSKAMTIFSGGEVSMNTTNIVSSAWLSISVPSSNYNAIVLRDTGTTYSAGNYYQLFVNSTNAIAGSVAHPTATTTLFSSTSDYRLKEDLKDFNGIDILSNIKFYDFKWIDENVRMYGVMAHELEQCVPLCVTGTKDEIDKEGKIIAQGVDYSKLTPVLGKALQEAIYKIQELNEKLIRNNIN